MRMMWRWARRRPMLTMGLGLLTVFVALNVLAYRHAHALTHFSDDGWVRLEGGRWRGKPEQMSAFDKMGALVNGVAIRRPQDERRPSDVGLTYDVHSFAGEAGPLEAWFIPHEKPVGVVLLFHGFTACKARLVPEAQAFHELGYACFLVDFRGSGGSAGDTTTIGYREADDVARAVDHVRVNWPGQRLILFGQSMGSAAVLRALAELGTQADVAILECPFDRLLSAVQARFAAMRVPSVPGAHLMVFWGGRQHGFNGFQHEPVEYARKVKCPVLLLNGDRDVRVSGAQIREIHGNLGGEKRLHFFEGLGHESYVARQPDAWKREIAAFLTGPPQE